MSREQGSTPICDDERDRCRECGMEFVPIEVAEVLEERALKAEAALKALPSETAHIQGLVTASTHAAPQVPEVREAPGNPIVSSPAVAAPSDDKKCDVAAPKDLAEANEIIRILRSELAAVAVAVGRSNADGYDVDWFDLHKDCALRSAVARRLWLWKNFVDGRPEYWAFDNPYPCQPSGDPMTLGEPCGYAIVKESARGRKDVTDDQVIEAIKRSIARSATVAFTPTPTAYFYLCPKCEREVQWEGPDAEISGLSKLKHSVCGTPVEIVRRSADRTISPPND